MLASALALPFYDADDFHTQENVDKMRAGQPLNDEDRGPWLNILAEKLAEWNTATGAVLACSALKEKYRILLAQKVKDIQWIYLKGSFELIYSRMQERSSHYMKADMLHSQFDDLEEPAYGWHVAIEASPDVLLEYLLKMIRQER